MSITILNPACSPACRISAASATSSSGVSVSGVMDPRSASIANILVGNERARPYSNVP